MFDTQGSGGLDRVIVRRGRWKVGEETKGRRGKEGEWEFGVEVGVGVGDGGMKRVDVDEGEGALRGCKQPWREKLLVISPRRRRRRRRQGEEKGTAQSIQ